MHSYVDGRHVERDGIDEVPVVLVNVTLKTLVGACLVDPSIGWLTYDDTITVNMSVNVCAGK